MLAALLGFKHLGWVPNDIDVYSTKSFESVAASWKVDFDRDEHAYRDLRVESYVLFWAERPVDGAAKRLYTHNVPRHYLPCLNWVTVPTLFRSRYLFDRVQWDGFAHRERRRAVETTN